MLKIQRKGQNGYLVSTYKIGETFLYNNHLYMVIEENNLRRYLNMETARVETTLDYAKSVPHVQCTVSYEFTEKQK